MTGSIALTNGGGGGAPSAPAPSGSSSRPQVDRAVLKMYEAKPAKGGSSPGSPLGEIAFQFNPKELTIAKSAKWERKPARNAQSAGPAEFKGADPCKLTLEIFFDATGSHDGSVVASVEKLFSCCVPTQQSRSKKKATPPLVVFTWGQITSFPAFITSVSAKYTLFAPNGTPIRATCSVSLEEMPGEHGKQNPTSGSVAAQRVHRVVSGDSLASLAYREYGDATMWRVLAEYNGVDDPQRLRSGSMLLLPDPDELLTAGR